MSDNSMNTEYVTEPIRITPRVGMAPTMAGGLAITVDGEHIDHLEEHELENMEEVVADVLDEIEHMGHSTASERKFDRFIQESIGYQAEITAMLFQARQAAENNNYREINYDTLKQVIGMLQTHASMLDVMSQQLQNWEDMDN